MSAHVHVSRTGEAYGFNILLGFCGFARKSNNAEENPCKVEEHPSKIETHQALSGKTSSNIENNLSKIINPSKC